MCRFVGDVKYKRLETPRIRNADLYQLALRHRHRAPVRMLIYAAGEEEPAEHEVVHIGKRLETVMLDFATSPEDLLAQVALVAQGIRGQANQRWRGRPAA